MIAPALKVCSRCTDVPIRKRCGECQRAYWRYCKDVAASRPRAARPPQRWPDNLDRRSSMGRAVAAYLSCRQHHATNEGREPTPYAGPVAWDMLDALETDFDRWLELARSVLDVAKERG